MKTNMVTSSMPLFIDVWRVIQTARKYRHLQKILDKRMSCNWMHTYVARPPIANRERTVFAPLFHTFIQLCHKSYSIQHQRFIGIVEDQTTWFLHFLFHISVLVQCLANESLDLRTSLVVAQIQHRKNVFSKTTPLGRNLS